MKLVFSTDSFKLMGRAYPNFPLILNSAMCIVPEALDFLINECVRRGRVNSEDSWAIYGTAIYDYLAFCEANELAWNDVTERDNPILAVYRDWSISECGLSKSTVNARLRVIIKFYKFSFRQGWISSVPYRLEEVRVRSPKGFLVHTDTSGGVVLAPDVMVKNTRTTLGVLTHHQVTQLIASITNPEHLLLTRLALTTGLRKQELLTFPVKYIRNPSEFVGSKYHVRVNLDPGDMVLKGGKPRGIDIPMGLMEDLWRYVQLERGRRSNITGEHQKILFLNSQGLPWSSKGRGLNKVYNDLGLPFHVRPHILRHTYATHSLYFLRKLKTTFDPLLYIRDRMGHASLSTTEQYLHYLSILESDVMDQFQTELDEMCRGIAL